MTTIPQVINTPKLLKFSSEFSGVSVYTIDAKYLYNSTFLNTTNRSVYRISLVSCRISNRIYNIHSALKNNVIHTLTGDVTIPDGYWSLTKYGPDITSYVNGVIPGTITKNSPTMITVKDVYTYSTPDYAPSWLGLNMTSIPISDNLPTKSFGLRGNINVVFNTQIDMNFQKIQPTIPLPGAKALYSLGGVVLTQGNIFSNTGNAVSSPVQYQNVGPAPIGDFQAIGTVIGCGEIPITSQTDPVPQYDGPTISIQPCGSFPLGVLPERVKNATVCLCDDYGNLFYIEGHVEIIVKIDV
jgi:hypothetical protein